MWVFTAENPPRLTEIAVSVDGAADLANQDDVYLYEEIDFSVAVQLPSQRPAPSPQHVLKVRDLLENRFNSGWFRDTANLVSPQACYLLNPGFTEIEITDIDARTVADEKPRGALWTSSLLPDSTPTWQTHEREEFARLSRTLYHLHFDPQQVSVYTIDSFADFQTLLLNFAQHNTNGRATVRWGDVAKQFDAVHLTARGLVDADGVQFQTPYGLAELRGWGSESTAWLRTVSGTRLKLATYF